jgi:sporulation protein YlmC with PRC-barrel domain
MANREVHIELLLGRRVLDSTGKSVGRIEEVIAERQGDEWVVREYLVGSAALLQRLSAVEVGRAFLGLFRAKKNTGYRVPWDKLDLTDLEKPSLRCPSDELETLTVGPKKRGQGTKKGTKT